MTAQETQDMLAAMDQDQTKGNSSFWTPDEGENDIRFLPPLKPNGEKLPYFRHRTHWIDGTPYECLDQTIVDKHGNLHDAQLCPACKVSKKLYKMSEKDTEERDLAYNLSAKDRFVFRIIDRKKGEDAQPEFYEVGPTISKKFSSVMKSGKYGNIVHPLEGRDFTIDKQGTGRKTNYDNSLPSPNITPIFADKNKIKDVLTKAIDMKYNDLVEFRATKEEIEIAVNEFLNPDSIGEQDVPSVPKSAPAKTATKSATPAKAAVNEANDDDNADTDQIDDILGEFL